MKPLGPYLEDRCHDGVTAHGVDIADVDFQLGLARHAVHGVGADLKQPCRQHSKLEYLTL